MVAWSILRSLVTVRSPRPAGAGSVDHQLLQSPLHRLASEGSEVISDISAELGDYVDLLAEVDPDQLTRNEALAYWINLYNAGGLTVAGEAQRKGESSVLRVPGGFRRKFVEVAGESLSLDDIEHGKLRRFGDPRIHGALVCGSVSCPTLNSGPYDGSGLSDQLDDQLRYFLDAGGCVAERDRGVVTLSRVFLWFGTDFVRPHRMPTLWPTMSRSAVVTALTPWLDAEVAEWIESTRPKVEFQSYDWSLRCAVR